MPWIEVHVFGTYPTGEGIILKLPNNSYAVVDCCQTTASCTAMCDFLRERNIKRLEFVCLTHPHHDHYAGLVEILTEFPTQHFFRSEAFTQQMLKKSVKAEQYRAIAYDDLNKRNQVEYLISIDRLLKAKKTNIVSVGSRRTVYPFKEFRNPSFEILGFSPCGNEVQKYHDSLDRCFEKGKLKRKQPKLDHNTISIGLLLRATKFSIILGGDVLNANWDEAIATCNFSCPKPALYKVSHHGSSSSYSTTLKNSVLDKSPVCVLTGYRNQLPESKILKELAGLSSDCYLAHEGFLKKEKERLGDSDLALLAKSGFEGSSRLRRSDTGRCSFFFDKQRGLERVELQEAARI